MYTANKNSNWDSGSLVGRGDTEDSDYDTIGAEGDELTEEQPESKRNPADHLKPWQYKKGQSGNPSGRPKGISLKEYVKSKFSSMTDEEKEEFIHGLNKDTIWEMGEGKPDTKGDLKIEVPDNLIELIKHGTANKGGDNKLPE